MVHITSLVMEKMQFNYFPIRSLWELSVAMIFSFPPFVISPSLSRGVARNFMKMKVANRIAEISAEAQHFLQYCMCAQRKLRSACAYTHFKRNLYCSSHESLDVSLISAKQWLWSVCAFAQADLSHYLVDMSSSRKCCAPPIWWHMNKF